MDNRINQEIAYEIMKTDKYDMLMSGYVVNFSREELDDYISCQNELDINTIKIQKEWFGYFVKVDKPTITRYLEKKKKGGKNLIIYGGVE